MLFLRCEIIETAKTWGDKVTQISRSNGVAEKFTAVAVSHIFGWSGGVPIFSVVAALTAFGRQQQLDSVAEGLLVVVVIQQITCWLVIWFVLGWNVLLVMFRLSRKPCLMRLILHRLSWSCVTDDVPCDKIFTICLHAF